MRGTDVNEYRWRFDTCAMSCLLGNVNGKMVQQLLAIHDPGMEDSNGLFNYNFTFIVEPLCKYYCILKGKLMHIFLIMLMLSVRGEIYLVAASDHYTCHFSCHMYHMPICPSYRYIVQCTCIMYAMHGYKKDDMIFIISYTCIFLV